MYDQELLLTQYLSNLKEGDMVFTTVDSKSIYRHRVARVTKTQLVLESNARYKIADGNMVGGTSWSRDRILVPTPVIEAAWRRQYLDRWAEKTFPGLFASLTSDQQVALHKQVTATVAENRSAQASADDQKVG
ncbi:hypothetical protein F2S72_09085 [Pseudomonas syringae pv. actinidiae]|nr:hypothetical protein [Pseudomonas syringae pv. actinidiae]